MCICICFILYIRIYTLPNGNSDENPHVLPAKSLRVSMKVYENPIQNPIRKSLVFHLINIPIPNLSARARCLCPICLWRAVGGGSGCGGRGVWLKWGSIHRSSWIFVSFPKKNTKEVEIFHSYVELPDGNSNRSSGERRERFWAFVGSMFPTIYSLWTMGSRLEFLRVSQLHKSIWKIGGAKQTVEICEISDWSRVRTIRQIQIYHQMCELWYMTWSRLNIMFVD